MFFLFFLCSWSDLPQTWLPKSQQWNGHKWGGAYSPVHTPVNIFTSHKVEASPAWQLSHSAAHWLLTTIGPNKTVPPPPRATKTTKLSTIKPAGGIVSDMSRWTLPLFKDPERLQMHRSGGPRRLFQLASPQATFSLFRLLLRMFHHTCWGFPLHFQPICPNMTPLLSLMRHQTGNKCVLNLTLTRTDMWPTKMTKHRHMDSWNPHLFILLLLLVWAC